MSASIQQIPWGIEQRLQFIEMCLFWFGKVNRGDIIRRFGVSVPQASADLSRYQGSAQKNVSYDRSKKRYIATEGFSPQFYNPDVWHFLSEIGSIAQKNFNNDESWFVFTPNVGVMPTVHRYIDLDVLRSLVLAIYNEQAIEIFYHSIRPEYPEPDWRWISPHAFQNDGCRWHVRAYCHNERKFRDFKLSRIFQTGGFDEQAAAAEDDRFWWEHFNVILVPNKALSSSQQTSIAKQYRMSNGKLSITVRKAILYYFKNSLHIDLRESSLPPHNLPLTVENRDEFENALREVTS